MTALLSTPLVRTHLHIDTEACQLSQVPRYHSQVVAWFKSISMNIQTEEHRTRHVDQTAHCAMLLALLTVDGDEGGWAGPRPGHVPRHAAVVSRVRQPGLQS